MINQQLLEFIKRQMQQGTAKETIEKELLANSWTRVDIEEAYRAIGTIPAPAPTPAPTPTPIQPQPQFSNTILTSNAVPVSDFSSLNNNLNAGINTPKLNPDVSIREKSHSGKKIFLIVLVLFLFAIATSAYYFRNDLTSLPIIKDFFPNKNTVVNEGPVPTAPVAQTNPDQNLPTSATGAETEQLAQPENQINGNSNNIQTNINNNQQPQTINYKKESNDSADVSFSYPSVWVLKKQIIGKSAMVGAYMIQPDTKNTNDLITINMAGQLS